jgi:hypothetical protein
MHPAVQAILADLDTWGFLTLQRECRRCQYYWVAVVPVACDHGTYPCLECCRLYCPVCDFVELDVQRLRWRQVLERQRARN